MISGEKSRTPTVGVAFFMSSSKIYLNVEKSPFEHSLVLLVSANVFTRLEQKQHCHCAARRLRKCTKPLVCAWFPGKISSNNNFAFKNCSYKSTLFESERNLKAETTEILIIESSKCVITNAAITRMEVSITSWGVETLHHHHVIIIISWSCWLPLYIVTWLTCMQHEKKELKWDTWKK